jgi:uncharacterized protein (DUF1810 family)
LSDAYDLGRFTKAQDPVWESVTRELREGHKTSHWMWFVFPQIAGLGFSATAKTYAISSLAEARAYLDDPVLGPRLRDATKLVTSIRGRAIEAIFPYPDHLKFWSSMTLFAHAAPDRAIFEQALALYFGGTYDKMTLEKLGVLPGQ